MELIRRRWRTPRSTNRCGQLIPRRRRRRRFLLSWEKVSWRNKTWWQTDHPGLLKGYFMRTEFSYRSSYPMNFPGGGGRKKERERRIFLSPSTDPRQKKNSARRTLGKLLRYAIRAYWLPSNRIANFLFFWIPPVKLGEGEKIEKSNEFARRQDFFLPVQRLEICIFKGSLSENEIRYICSISVPIYGNLRSPGDFIHRRSSMCTRPLRVLFTSLLAIIFRR